MYCEKCEKELNDGELCNCSSQATEINLRRKRAKRALVGIILCAIVVLSVIAFSDVFEISPVTNSEKVTNNIKFEAIGSEFVIETTKEKYSAGELSGNIYTNEWANLKIELDDRFTQAPQESYDVYENLLTDCGAYFIAEGDGDEIGIVFYKGGGYTVKEYCEETLESWMDSVRVHVNEVFSQEYINNIVYEKNAKPVEIAGEEYLGAFLTVRFENGLSTVYSDYCAEKDRKIIDIVVVADSLEESLDLVGDFEALK